MSLVLLSIHERPILNRFTEANSGTRSINSAWFWSAVHLAFQSVRGKVKTSSEKNKENTQLIQHWTSYRPRRVFGGRQRDWRSITAIRIGRSREVGSVTSTSGSNLNPNPDRTSHNSGPAPVDCSQENHWHPRHPIWWCHHDHQIMHSWFFVFKSKLFADKEQSDGRKDFQLRARSITR